MSMTIDRKTIPAMTIEEFAEANGLTMEVRERKKPVGDHARFYASFEGVEIMDRGFLMSTFGDGATEAQAIKAYAKELSLKRIAVGAHTPLRREIEVPRLR